MNSNPPKGNRPHRTFYWLAAMIGGVTLINLPGLFGWGWPSHRDTNLLISFYVIGYFAGEIGAAWTHGERRERLLLVAGFTLLASWVGWRLWNHPLSASFVLLALGVGLVGVAVGRWMGGKLS